ncbi:MAG: aspartate dehydrogenase [Candidatus Omnitrophota bacterium]
MKKTKKLRVGIVGCGAIGSRIAKSISQELKSDCALSALFDIDTEKSKKLSAKFSAKNLIKKNLSDLIRSCDLVVEAVTSTETQKIVSDVLRAKKHVLAMSVGKLLYADKLFALARKNKCALLLPSGAIAGLDAIKAASLRNISSVVLTTRKPPVGFANSAYIIKKNIDLNAIACETVLFDGHVDDAVHWFPKNINVAATLAIASNCKEKVRVRILTSPEFKLNSHEIEVIGDFGRMVSRTDNVVCPDNPKTSYLAVLSAIQTLKQFFNTVKIGT